MTQATLQTGTGATDGRPRLPLAFKIIVWVVVPIFLMSTGALVALMIMQRGGQQSSGGGAGAAAHAYDPLKPDFGFEGMKLPAFTLIDQEGRTASIDVFAGRISIVGLVFTNCPLACPVMTSQMAAMQRSLADAPVRFVTISLDPVHDTPAALKEYAAKFGVDTSRWTLLTETNAGTPESGKNPYSWRVLAETFKHHIDLDPTTAIPLADGTQMQSIQHPPHLFLVGPGGQVLGQYNSKIADDMRALEDRARRAGIALAGRGGRL